MPESLESLKYFETFFRTLSDPHQKGSVEIHPTARVEKSAVLGKGVKVGPLSYVGPHANIADDVLIGSNVMIDGRVTIGPRTQLWSFVTLGVIPQHVRFKGEESTLAIGSDNIFREYTNISLGTEIGHNKTVIGSRNVFSAFSHVGHDGIIGNDVFFSNGINLGGHIEIQDGVVFGSMVGVHQFCRIGKWSHLESGSMVSQDVVPFCMVRGDRATVSGLNIEGLKKAGISGTRFDNIKKMFDFLFKENLTLEESFDMIEKEIPTSEDKLSFLEFVRLSERGICR